MWVLLLVMATLVLLLYRHFGLASLSTLEGAQRDGLPVGEEAPLLTGVNASGEPVAVTPGDESPTLLLFASPECQPCKAVAPHLNELDEQAKESGIGLNVLAVASGTDSTARRVIESFDPSFEVIADDRTGVFDKYRVRVTPFAFVIDTNHRIRAKGLCGDAVRLRELLLAAGLAEAASVMEPAINATKRELEARAVAGSGMEER